MRNPLSVYIHWPYCKSICSYCDFNRVIEKNVDFSRIQSVFLEEIKYFFEKIGKNYYVNTIFFGGGTPSLMPPQLMSSLVEQVMKCQGSMHNCSTEFSTKTIPEISMEANPTSIEMSKLNDFKAAGVNRLSIGIQSFDQGDLSFLSRQHSSTEAKKAISTAIDVFGAESVSIDLIYGLPSHVKNKAHWIETLKTGLSFKLGHMSAYQLTLEKKTKLYRDYHNMKKRDFELPDEEQSLDLYRETIAQFKLAGLQQYEVSNYSRNRLLQCRHNLAYWTSSDFIGFGPGASSRLTIFESSDLSAIRKGFIQHPDPNQWMQLNVGERNVKHETLTEVQTLTEVLMMGLRMNAGIDNEVFERVFSGKSYQNLISNEKLVTLAEKNLLDLSEKDRLKVTEKGMEVLDSIVKYLIS